METGAAAREAGRFGPVGGWLRAALAAAALLSALGGAGPTLAADPTLVSAGLSGGELAVSVAEARLGPRVGAVRGHDLIEGDLGVARVVDARGTGGGWSLRVTVAVERAPGAPALPSDALSIESVEVTPEAGSAPRNGVTYPLTVPLAEGAAPTRFFSAATDSGMGTVAVRPKVRLRVPTAAPAGAYQARVMIGVVAGP